MCLDRRDRCTATPSCAMFAVWKLGQERMLEVYRSATLDKLAMQRVPAMAAAGRARADGAVERDG